MVTGKYKSMFSFVDKTYVCFVLLKIFVLISVLVLDFYIPNKVKEIALLLALPVGLLLNAVIPPKNTEI